MDADDVLWYVRTRKTTNDIARNRRQQEVLQAIFEKLVSMDALRRAPEFYKLYKDSVTDRYRPGGRAQMAALCRQDRRSRAIPPRLP